MLLKEPQDDIPHYLNVDFMYKNGRAKHLYLSQGKNNSPEDQMIVPVPLNKP